MDDVLDLESFQARLEALCASADEMLADLMHDEGYAKTGLADTMAATVRNLYIAQEKLSTLRWPE